MKLIGVAIAVLICAAACSSDDDGASTQLTEPPEATSAPTSTGAATLEPSSTPTAAPTTTPAEPEAEETSTTAAQDESSIEILLGDAVRAYFDAREAASSGPRPDPTDPALAEVAASAELERLIQSIQDKVDAGQAIRPGEQALADIGVGFVEQAGDFATVAACSIDDGVIFDVATGDVVNDEVLTHNYRVDLALLDGVWKVTEIVRVQQWEGVGGCALATGDYPY